MAENGDSKKEFPLLGVILCCTSVPPENRSDLAATASQMGAMHKLDLTSDVTHLIVGDTDTPKYKFVARERPDVKCLLPSWIDAVRKSWLDGGETKVEALEAEHRVPTFCGLRICVTGFEDLAYRKLLEDLVNKNGGEYRGNLTKDVTHLIARVPSGTKHTYACEWGIKIVSAGWLMQSVERGMILEENLYNLLLPESERGQNAWVRKTVSSVSLGKRARDDDAAPAYSRKLRRTASAKLSSQNDYLWSDIVNKGMEAESIKGEQWDGLRKDITNTNGIIKVETNPPTDAPPIKEEPNTPKRSSYDVNRESEPKLNRQNKVLFRGKSFYMHGFDAKQTSILKQHLISHHAELIPDMEQFCSKVRSLNPGNIFLLVSHRMMACDIPKITSETRQPVVVTDLWIERCLHYKEFVDPTMNCTSTPFPKFPLTGFQDLTICSTAFQGVDLLHLFKAVRLMGATYSEFLVPTASVLICNVHVPGSEKLQCATQWKIPIVTDHWLWDSIREGVLKPFDPYLNQPPRIEPPNLNSGPFDKSKKDESRNKSPEKSPLEHGEAGKGRSLVGRTPDLPMNEIMAHQDHTNILLQNRKSEDEKTHGDPVPIPIEQSQIYNPSQAPAPSIPLREIAFNSSPPKPIIPSPLKTEIRPEYDEDSLGPVISSLLEHHQRSAANSASNPPSEAPKINRRRRQLLGRAPSGISGRSSGSINISRASSVDTINTDGLGTPLESSNSHAARNVSLNGSGGGGGVALWAYGEQHAEAAWEGADDRLQMTQLSYEDPDVQLWRERVVEKLGGAKEIEPDRAAGVGMRAESIGVVRDVVTKGMQAVAKRTRQALGR